MDLADQLLGIVSPERSKSFRDRLNAVVVRVILIHTIEEEMRYNKSWFAVQDIEVIDEQSPRLFTN